MATSSWTTPSQLPSSACPGLGSGRAGGGRRGKEDIKAFPCVSVHPPRRAVLSLQRSPVLLCSTPCCRLHPPLPAAAPTHPPWAGGEEAWEEGWGSGDPEDDAEDWDGYGEGQTDDAGDLVARIRL